MDNLEQAHRRIAELEEKLKSAEDQLRICEDRYRAAFEYTGTAMMVVEEDTTISMANHRLEELTGYPQEEGSKGRSWTEFVTPEEMPRLMEYHVKRMQHPSSVPSEYEFRLKHRSGELHDILMSVSMIPGTKKRLISLLDITARKRTEKSLQESERKFRELFENATDIIYTHDLEGNFTSCNAAAVRTYGYGADEILRLNIRDLVDPSSLAVAQAHLTEKLRGQERTDPYELLTRTKSGGEVWVEVSTRVIRDDGTSIAVQGIARNITDRKRAEMNLEESERRFRQTADLLPAVISDLDLDNRVVYVNKHGLDLLGYSMEDVAAGPQVRDLVSAECLDRALSDIANVLSDNYEYGALKEYRLLRKDGSPLDVVSTSAPLVVEGTVRGVRCCILDMTERNRTQEALRRGEEKFRRIVEHSPAGIAVLDGPNRLVDKNESFETLFGPDAGRFVLDEHVKIPERDWQAIRKGGHIHRESRTEAGGKVRYLYWLIAGLGAGDDSSILVQVQDVTEQRLAEEARLRTAQDAADKANRMVAGLRKEIMEKSRFHSMVSRSPLMKSIFDILPEMAQTEATVLVTGESGTGKELIARSLHELGSRKGKPFVAINCGALPDNLLESELFGYKAGAFTDAKKDKPGKFAVARGGSIFLDEIGDVSPAIQVKLLRVLQERVYEPLGGVESVKADARVIAATNRDLVAMVREGKFREDLFYRLKVLTVQLPPLRDRRCDVPLLCDHFVEVFNARYRKNVKGLSDDAVAALLAHTFPGNIRELENVIEHAFIFCKGDTIEAEHLPHEVRGNGGAGSPAVPGQAPDLGNVRDLDDLERAFLRKILVEVGGSKIKAAQRLGIHKTTLFRKLKQLGVE